MTITSEQRAEWAADSLLAYATKKEGGAEFYDTAEAVLTDLLADLMHYAVREGIDLRRCAIRAETHYDAELAEHVSGDGPSGDSGSPRLESACLDLDRFDDVEVQPVFEDEEEGYCEPVPDAPHTASFWTVYGHLREGGVDALIDCYDEPSADIAADILTRLLILTGRRAS